jgi:hypothetical protein
MYLYWRVGGVTMSEKSTDVTERLQKIGETISDYKEKIVSTFKDMDVEVKDWHFAVGKAEKEYVVEIDLKIGIKPKTA